MGFRHLLSGFDTVAIAYYLRPGFDAAFSFEQLLVDKERMALVKGEQELSVTIAGKSFLLRRNGSASGYPLVLRHSTMTIECGPNNMPSFFVTYRSEALWRHGIGALHEEFLAWATSVGLVALKPETLSRVDIAFDYEVDPVPFVDDHFVTLSAKDSQHREDRTTQTLSFGVTPVRLRVYDKVAEIEQQSKKFWLYEIWGTAGKVWRIEWQCRKDVLRRFGLRSVEDLLDRCGDLLRYLATEHDSLRAPNGDSNRSRWPVHALWEDVIERGRSFEAQGVYRAIDPSLSQRERLLRIGISVYGNLKRIAAIQAEQQSTDWVSLEAAMDSLRSMIKKVHNPLSWDLDVKRKALEESIGGAHR